MAGRRLTMENYNGLCSRGAVKASHGMGTAGDSIKESWSISGTTMAVVRLLRRTPNTSNYMVGYSTSFPYIAKNLLQIQQNQKLPQL